MGLFDKKYCDICGEKIGLLGNRKLEDGNLCKNCAKKLSPWFSERRHSTVDSIKQQLAYREENKAKVAQLHITRSFGEGRRVLLDDTNRWFTVTRERDLAAENPDILSFDDLTGCRLDIDESHREVMRRNEKGESVSYNPPRYEYSYDFDIILTVNNPYFDEMKFRLNNGSVNVVTEAMSNFGRSGIGSFFGGMAQGFDPSYNPEYRKYRQMADDLVAAMNTLIGGAHRQPAQQPMQQPVQQTAVPQQNAVPAGPWVCTSCGASNSGKFCEHCGTPRP